MNISIIIPVKDRVESTKRLLDELCEQKTWYPQTEIIVIENGSTCDMSFLDNYDVVLVHEEMKGVNHARNVGLNLAKGDYICFCDNDDMVSKNYLDVLYTYIHKNVGYDWFAFQWYSDERPVLMEGFDVNDPMKFNWALWGYCFSRRLFDNFRFEDDGFAGGDQKIREVMCQKLKGYFIHELLYHFTWEGNEDSLSHLHNRGIPT